MRGGWAAHRLTPHVFEQQRGVSGGDDESGAGGFILDAAVLVAFSYLEGRLGKTPGKWLLRIRVLGTDLAPCGFWRALVRNLLTFVDGFFNFLVGVLLVALTENWQHLGDLAARTIVVVDEKGAQ